jgi:hypothetical protein
VSPDDVRVFLRDELPEGFERDTTSRELSSAPEFPSSDDPNVILGALSLTEKFDASTDELRENSKALDTPERLAALKVEAARHGANAVIASGGRYQQAPWSTSRYEASYEAVYLSTKPRAYPTVDELLKRLSLPDGFREIQRVSLDLADLRTATLDVPLKRGNCYLLALAFALTWKKRLPVGSYVVATALSYAPVRFVLDYFRLHEGAESDPRYGGLTPGQWACVALFVFGLVMWKKMRDIQASGEDVYAPFMARGATAEADAPAAAENAAH